MATLQELEEALVKADAAGATEDARKLADEIVRVRAQEARNSPSVMNDAPRPSFTDYLKDVAKRKVAGLAGNLQGTVAGMKGEDSEKARALAEQRARAAMGYEGLRPPSNDAQRWAAEGLTEVVDPVNYAAGSGGLVRKGLSSVLPGVGAQVGMDAAGDSEALKVVGALAGGGLGGATNASVGRAANAARAITPGGRAAMSQTMLNQAESHLQSLIAEAVKADPSLAAKIMEAQRQAAQAGVKLPLSALTDNTVIEAAIRGIAARNPTFGQKYIEEYQQAKQQIKQAQASLFGSPADANVTISNKLKTTPDIDSEQARSLSKIDEQARRLSEPFRYTENDPEMARRIGNLVDKDAKRVSPEGSRLFEEAKKKANETGAALTSESATELRKEISAHLAESKYQKFPNLIDRALKTFGKDEGGPTGVTYEDARSLQMEISALLRGKTTPEEERLLKNLQGKLDGLMEKDFPEEVWKTLRAGRTQYAHDISLKDFSLAAMDESGKIDPKRAAKWITENRSKVSDIVVTDKEGNVLGSLRESLAPVEKIAALMAHKAKVEGFFGKARLERLAETQNMAPETFINRVMSDPQYLDKTLKTYAGDKEMMQAMRSYVLDDALSAGGNIGDWMKDKSRSTTISKLFGMGYINQVNRLADIAEKLAKDPQKLNIDIEHGVRKDWFEQKFGVPLSMIFSKLRNPLMSPQQKVVELASKGLTSKAAVKFDQKLMDLLADPEKLVDFVNRLDAGAAQRSTEQVADALQKYLSSEVGRTFSETGRGMRVGAASYQQSGDQYK